MEALKATAQGVLARLLTESLLGLAISLATLRLALEAKRALAKTDLE